MKITLNRNVIALQKGLVCPPNDGMDNRIPVATLQAHLMQWGYMLDEDSFMELSKSDLSFISNFNNEIITYLKTVTGGKKTYVPFYKNFPEEVMSKTDYELYFNLVKHYWSGGKWEPSTVEFERPINFENIKYTMLKYGTSERFSSIFKDLVSVNTSLTPNDLEVIKWFVTSGEKLVFPNVIPFKENLCTLAAMGIEGLPIKTTTDVLRIAVHMSGGDISLPKLPRKKIKKGRWGGEVDNVERNKFKFKRFTRTQRKYLLSLLENTNCDAKEMVLRDQRWIRLGEILHPMEYKNKYPKAADAFNKIRNENVKSWYGILNDGFKRDLESGLKILSQKPGEFARRIDWLIRTYTKQGELQLIMKYLNESLKGTSNKVLFEVYTHFENRMEPVTNRSIKIKGARKKTELPSLPAIPKRIVETIHSKLFETLKEKFSKLESLGNCWIDEELKKIPLPTNMRSLNFSAKPVVRGQRIPFDNPEAKVIRAFLHFSKKSKSITIDLSAILIGDRTSAIVDWSHQTGGDVCVHSGDSFARTGNCAEYVDVDVEKALKKGFKYVLIQLNNWNQAEALYNENYFGVMERNFPKSNGLWLPESITNCYIINNLKAKTNCAVLDLESREYIIIDEDCNENGINNASITDFKTIQSYLNPPKVSVYDLLLLHVEARGKQVTLDNNVDTYFKFEDFCNSYEETGKLMGV